MDSVNSINHSVNHARRKEKRFSCTIQSPFPSLPQNAMYEVLVGWNFTPELPGTMIPDDDAEAFQGP